MFQGKSDRKQNRKNQSKTIRLDMEPLEPRRYLAADLPLFAPSPADLFPAGTQQFASDTQQGTDQHQHDHCDNENHNHQHETNHQHDHGPGCQCSNCMAANGPHNHEPGCQCSHCMGSNTHDHNHDHGDGQGILEDDLPLEPQDVIDADLDAESTLLLSGQAGNLVPLEDTFRLHSLPGANHTIYLDFDGHVTEGTPWNNSYGIDSIVSPAYDADGDPSTFNTTELERIQRIWQRVAEDFAPFQVNVTTEEPGAAALSKTNGSDPTWGNRVIITTDNFANCGCGGFAYIGSFNDNIDNPSFVFNGGETGVSEAASHEVGHTLFLSHDGKTDGTSYYRGHGADGTEEEWAPLMGVGYYTNMTTWDNGTYFSANNGQSNANFNKGPSDLDVITENNGFGFRADDHGNATANSSALQVIGENESDPLLVDVDSFGIISQPNDVDMFSFTTGEGEINLDIESYIAQTHVSQDDGSFETSYETTPINNKGSNLDILATIYNEDGDVVATSNPSGLSAEFTDLFLSAGTYYVSIDGAGFGNWTTDPPTGYTDYVSLGQYQITGTIVILDPNTPPIANADFGVADEDGSVVISPLDNDSDPDGDSLSLISYTQGNYGSVTNNGDGTLTYQPEADFNGTDTFEYTISDGGTGRATGSIEITVTPIPDIDLIAIDSEKFEGDAGFTTFTFEVRFDEPASSNLTVDWAVSTTGDTDANDFGGNYPSGTASFSEGQSSQTISVEVSGDTAGEFDETFTVNLVTASLGVIRGASAFGTILNDDFCSTNIALIDRQIFINGTDDSDTASVSMLNPLTVQAELSGFIPCSFALADVSSILFHGNDGDDTFTNNTALNSNAYGHNGNDSFQGGTAIDVSWGGPGMDSFASSDGADYAYGESGDDQFILNSGNNIESLFVNFGTGDDSWVNQYGAIDFPLTLQFLHGFNHQYDPNTKTVISDQVSSVGNAVTVGNNGPNAAFQISSGEIVTLGPVTELSVNMLDFSGDNLNVNLANPLSGNLDVGLGSGNRTLNFTGSNNFIGGDLSITNGEGYFEQTVNLAVNSNLFVSGSGQIDLGFHADTVNVNGRQVIFDGPLELDRVNTLFNDGTLEVNGDLDFDVSDEIESSQLIDNAIMEIAGNLNYRGSAVTDRISLSDTSMVGGNIDVRTGEGNNRADLMGMLGGTQVKYIGGNGIDEVQLGTTGTPAAVNIKTKFGNDTVVLKSQAEISPNAFRIDFGGGDDTFTSEFGKFNFNATLLNLDGFDAFYDLSTGNLDVVQNGNSGDVTIDNNGDNSAIRFGNGSMNTLTPANDVRLLLTSNSMTNVVADFDNPRIGNTVFQMRSGDRNLNLTGDSNYFAGLLRVEAGNGEQIVNIAATRNLNVDGTFIFNGRNGYDTLQATHAVDVSGAMLLRGVNNFVNNAGLDVGGDFNVVTMNEDQDTRLISNTEFNVGGNLTYLGGDGKDAINFKSTGATIAGYTYIDLANSNNSRQSVMLTGGFATDNLVIDSGFSLNGTYLNTDRDTVVTNDVIVNFSAAGGINTANFFGTYYGNYGTYRGGNSSDFVTFGAAAKDMLFASLMGSGNDLFIIDSSTELDFLYIDFGLGNDQLDNQLGDPLPFGYKFVNL